MNSGVEHPTPPDLEAANALRPISVYPGKTQLKLYSGTYHILTLFSPQPGKLFVRGAGSGSVKELPGGAFMIGRNHPVFTEEFVGKDGYKCMSREQALITTGFDQKDGHPDFAILNRGKNGTYYRIEELSGASTDTPSEKAEPKEGGVVRHTLATSNSATFRPREQYQASRTPSFVFFNGRGDEIGTAVATGDDRFLFNFNDGSPSQYIDKDETFSMDKDPSKNAKNRIRNLIPSLVTESTLAFAITGPSSELKITNRGRFSFTVEMRPPFGWKGRQQ
jgi:hypothetical protein